MFLTPDIEKIIVNYLEENNISDKSVIQIYNSLPIPSNKSLSDDEADFILQILDRLKNHGCIVQEVLQRK